MREFAIEHPGFTFLIVLVVFGSFVGGLWETLQVRAQTTAVVSCVRAGGDPASCQDAVFNRRPEVQPTETP